MCLYQVRQSAVWQARGFAEAPAAKAAGGDLATTEDINWDLFDTLITSDEGQRELAGLRSAIATYQQKVDDMAKVRRNPGVHAHTYTHTHTHKEAQ